MSKIVPLNYTVFGQRVGLDNNAPVVKVNQGSTPEGTIDVRISGMTTIDSLSYTIYRLAAPTTDESRWSRIEPELYASYPDALNVSSETISAGHHRLTWRFDSSVLPNVAHSQYYGIEIYINEGDDASVAQYSPNIVIQIDNMIDWTGVTGCAGASFYGITGPAGGIDGIITSINYSPQATPPAYEEGTLYYDDVDHSLSYYNDNSEVTVNIGRELLVRVTNMTGSTITNGSIVYISASNGDNPLIALADASDIDTSSVIGIATHDINHGESGYVTKFGLVRHVNTSSYSVGEKLYLSTTPGQYTNTRYSDGYNKIVPVAVVVRVNANSGILLADTGHIDCEPLLKTLRDTSGLTGAQAGDSLVYDGSNWIGRNYPDITKEPTGFTDPSNITVSYDSAARTITLTGNVSAYFKGAPVTDLVSGWVSDPIPEATPAQPYFLYHDGSDFVWSTTPWTLDKLQIAYVAYSDDGFLFALRECHDMMPWQTHHELHSVIGTYKESGGDLSDYTLSSTSDRRPDVSATVIHDEDLSSTLSALTTKSYTQHYLENGSNDSVFLEAQTDVVPVNGNIPYWNQWTGTAWQQTPMTNNSYMSVYLIAMQTTADSDSQEFRYMWMQGQSNGTLSSQQNAGPSSLNLGDLTTASPEFVFIKQLILRYTGGDWYISQVIDISGSKTTQVTSAGGQYLSVVNTGAGLTGLGTTTSPLALDAMDESINISVTAPGNGLVHEYRAPYDLTLTSYQIVSSPTGAISVDVLRSDYDNYPPTESIAGATGIVLLNNIKESDSTLSGWTTTINEGDFLRFVASGETGLDSYFISLNFKK